MTPTPDVAMAVARLTRHCSLMEAAPQYKWPDYLPDIRLVLAHLTTLSARNKALADLLGEAAQRMEPFAFKASPSLRLVFTSHDGLTAPGLQKELEGQIVGILIGPWHSHLETPHVHGVVKEIRKALAKITAALAAEEDRK